MLVNWQIMSADITTLKLLVITTVVAVYETPNTANTINNLTPTKRLTPQQPNPKIIYQPNWESLDSRPLPGWYDDVKFGLFIVWGVYSVPGVISEWFQWYWQNSTYPATHAEAVAFMKKNYRPDFTYADFGPLFTAEFFDPTAWATLIRKSGAKYIVLTSKHGEGYTNWPSKYSWNWNSVDVGPNRDLVGDLAKALRATAPEVHFGLYYCLYEWLNPLYMDDSKSGFKTRNFLTTKVWPQIRELVEAYKPDIFWSDGDYETDDKYWNSTDFVAWLYNDSPVKDTVLTNDRWGSNVECKHGGYWTCNDKYNPGVLIAHKWENCMTIDISSWGYRRTMTINDVLSIQELVWTLMSTVSCGGNLLMNVGPTADGRIIPIFEERLTQMGQWLSANGEAVYSTKPWIFQNDTVTAGIWYTSKLLNDSGYVSSRLFNPQATHNTIVYAYFRVWPNNNKLLLGAPISTSGTTVSLLGYPGNLNFAQTPKGLAVDLSQIQWFRLPNTWGWILKLTKLEPSTRVPVIYMPQVQPGDDGKPLVTGHEIVSHV